EARRTLLFARVVRMPGSGDVRHYPARPHPRRRPAPNLLSQGHELMALFGRDRDGGTGAPRAVPVPAMPVDGIAPREVAMFERERLELRASARVQGSVTTASLVGREGAALSGRCSMGGGEAAARREKPTTTAPVSANRRAPDPPVPVPAAASR